MNNKKKIKKELKRRLKLLYSDKTELFSIEEVRQRIQEIRLKNL